MLTATRLKPTGKLVLAEAIYGSETTDGGLWIPPEARERFPNIGVVLTIGPEVSEDLREGDIAIFETEAFDVRQGYFDHFHVVVEDESGEVFHILPDIDIEPRFKEIMNDYEANPSTEDIWVQIKDVRTDEAFRFLCSNVREWGPISLSGVRDYRLEYVNSCMVDLATDEVGVVKTFYLIHEREILGVIRSEYGDQR